MNRTRFSSNQRGMGRRQAREGMPGMSDVPDQDLGRAMGRGMGRGNGYGCMNTQAPENDGRGFGNGRGRGGRGAGMRMRDGSCRNRFAAETAAPRTDTAEAQQD